MTTLAEQVDASIVPERLLAILAGFFGAVGALLAAIGLFGLLAYTVARRTKEIGIRMALGATRGDVIRMVVQRGLVGQRGARSRCAGGVLGDTIRRDCVEASAGGGVPPVAAAVVAMLVVAALATFMPARRATRVEPVIALRSE